jgi:hypothetical protein
MKAVSFASQRDVVRNPPDTTTVSDIELCIRQLETLQKLPLSNHTTLNSKKFCDRTVGLEMESCFFWHLSDEELAIIQSSVRSFQGGEISHAPSVTPTDLFYRNEITTQRFESYNVSVE